MKKVLLISTLSATLLLGDDYLQELLEFLDGKEFPIYGEFYSYDFNRNGTIEFNEWIYLASPSKTAYRLLGTLPTEENPFGFISIERPEDLPSKPQGYFTKIDFPRDPDPRFSWIYVGSEYPHPIYKLMGATPNHTFRYFDRDGDGRGDPLPDMEVLLEREKGSLTMRRRAIPPSGEAVRHGDYLLLAWNDLGMHCMDGDYSVFSILPPFNTLVVQLLKKGERPQLIGSGDGVTITYRSFPSLSGKLNTFSHGKTNFWHFTSLLYGKLEPEKGLGGFPTPSTIPSPLHFDTRWNWWSAEGIPITPFDDDGGFNPYPLVQVTARESLSGTVLAQTVTPLPVSTEMECRACHSSTSSSLEARPSQGWVNLDDPQRDYRFNILRLHDENHPRAVADNLEALRAKGYDYLPTGLEATARAGKPILCASCHRSNALPGSGVAGVSPLTQVIHRRHSSVKDPVSGLALNEIGGREGCYLCHPGKKTQCLRGAMGKEGIECQDCHGTLNAVGSEGREGWLDEPNCQSCHQNGYRYERAVIDLSTGTLREALDRRFATERERPVAGKSLYRYSRGHGGLYCAACHGSPHAIYPSSRPEDNLQNLGIQGYSGTLSDCTSCHRTMPSTSDGGPHGLHSMGEWWIEEHGEYAEKDLQNCRACHGQDYRGTPLSTTFKERLFRTEEGTFQLPKGKAVGCYECHRGPYGDDD
ncbi:MAG: hypothetical protein GXO19_07080 [Epsilonproteobacteria bacterium]|nr:hypothetical protein [Campylobacterota bacterium]NPA57477.1 hypothetical protein [Campylobacterota bacterium]